MKWKKKMTLPIVERASGQKDEQTQNDDPKEKFH